MPYPPIDDFVTFLPTADLEATTRFYREALGLRLVLDQGLCRIFEVSPNGFVGFCERESCADAHKVVLTLVTSELEAWHDRLIEIGVPTDGPVRANPTYRIDHFYAMDPNGYRVEVQRFHDSPWHSST
ncbi:MAG: VOC family protein [Fimbriimonadaceae bacterium]|nr:VOC family protein [Fimbriimonadaceae bacterium]